MIVCRVVRAVTVGNACNPVCIVYVRYDGHSWITYHDMIDVQVDPRSPCASGEHMFLCPTAERSPESLLPPHTMLVLLSDSVHLIPVVHRHSARLSIQLARASGCRAVPTRKAILDRALTERV